MKVEILWEKLNIFNLLFPGNDELIRHLNDILANPFTYDFIFLTNKLYIINLVFNLTTFLASFSISYHFQEFLC